MQSLRSRTPVTASTKRARCLSFPGGFEERILRRMKGRSEFIRAQLECLGDDGTSGRLQLPEEIGSLWIICILSTHAELRATDDKTLSAYLKVRSYEVLCAQLPLSCSYAPYSTWWHDFCVHASSQVPLSAASIIAMLYSLLVCVICMLFRLQSSSKTGTW